MDTLTTTCCIVGGGPAGMMLGWLLARAGVDVIVLEKHRDFFRDFRGDTIHPSTLELLAELGVLEEFLRLPHTEQATLTLNILGEAVPGPDLSRLPTRCKFIALMPQWDFLDFVRRQASQLPKFRIMMDAEVTGLVKNNGRVTGVTLKDSRTIEARLVVGCDGRSSTVRAEAGLPAVDLGAPIDVLWLRISRKPSDGEQVFGVITASDFFVMLNRDDYWQCAYLIEKGGLDARKARGLDAFRADLRRLAPFLGDRVSEVRSWDDVKLLTVMVDRLTKWATPGLLCIGDAAHAMSPLGGVGINLGIQDAVATANLLWRGLRDGSLTDADVDKVQARREPATRKTQSLQIALQTHVLAKVLRGRAASTLRVVRALLRHVPPVRRAMAAAIGVGFMPEHIATPWDS